MLIDAIDLSSICGALIANCIAAVFVAPFATAFALAIFHKLG